jgi:HK97 family phage major capsid protein
MKIHELKEKRAALIMEQRSILDAAQNDGSAHLNADQTEKFEKIEAEIRGLEDRISLEERTATREAEMANVDLTPEVEERSVTVDSEEYRDAFLKNVCGERLSEREMRALSIGSAGAGGNLATTQVSQQISQLREEANFMRQIGTVVEVSQKTAFATESSIGSAAYGAEGGSISESDHSFGQVTFNPVRLGRIMKVSEELLNYTGTFSADQLEAYIASSFARSFASAELAGFLVGDNSNAPRGIFDNATSGVTAASATAVTGDELIDLFYSVAAPYREAPTANWIISPEAAKAIRQLKNPVTSSGALNYLWTPGLGGAPDTLLGKPVYESDNVDVMTSGKKPILFGDTSYYQIVDFGGFEFSRLDELYAASGQVGVRGIAFNDGELLNTAACKVITLG